MSRGHNCLHCQAALPPHHALTTVHESELQQLLARIFPGKKQYSHAETSSLCRRCYAAIVNADQCKKATETAFDELLNLSASDDVLSSANQNSISSLVSKNNEKDVEWFLVEFNKSNNLVFTDGSNLGKEFAQENNSIIETFSGYCMAENKNVEADAHGSSNTENKYDSDCYISSPPETSKNDSEEKHFNCEDASLQSVESDTSITEEKRKEWLCCICNAGFKSKKMVLSHIKAKHKLSGNEALIVAKPSASKRTNCLNLEANVVHDSFVTDSDDNEKNLPPSKKRKLSNQQNKKFKSRVADIQVKWECVKCGKVYAQRTNCKYHVKKEHNINIKDCLDYVIEIPVSEKEEFTTETRFKCLKCEIFFKYPSWVVNHLLQVHKVPSEDTDQYFVKFDHVSHSESSRSKETSVNSEMKGLLYSASLKNKQWTCKICHSSYPDKKSIENHMSCDHQMRVSKSRAYMSIPESDDESIKSDQSDIKEESESCEKKGKKNLEKKKDWKCTKCGKMFCHRQDAIRHVQRLHGVNKSLRDQIVISVWDTEEKPASARKITIKNWKCKKCANGFVHKSDVINHLKTTHNIQKSLENFISHYMPSEDHQYRAILKDGLNEYISINEEYCISENDDDDDEKKDDKQQRQKWRCLICKDTFSTIERTQIHLQEDHGLQKKEKIKVHTKVKTDWACKDCGKTYGRRYDAIRHCKKAHNMSGEEGKSYVINKSLTDSSELEKLTDIWTQQEKERYASGKQQRWKCGKCERQFQVRSDAQRHLTDVHFIADVDHEFFIERNENLIRKWKCIPCGTLFYKRFETSRHVNLTHDIPWEKTKDFILYLEESQDSDIMEAKYIDTTKPYVCLACRKNFQNKKPLMQHLKNFHKASITNENFEKYVLNFKKNCCWSWKISSTCDTIGEKVKLSTFCYHISEETDMSEEDSVQLQQVQIKHLDGKEPFTEESWAKVIGTHSESLYNKSKSYRSKHDIDNKRFICMLCQLRYYKMKEAQRHLLLKHNISYVQGVNYIDEDTSVSVNLDVDGPSERVPRRRKTKGVEYSCFHCSVCLKDAQMFPSIQGHMLTFHKEKNENLHTKICRSVNVDVLKLANEDKMNFVCALCCVTFRSRVDAFKHVAKTHPSVSDFENFIFSKSDKFRTCVIKVNKEDGRTNIFCVDTESIVNDIVFKKEFVRIEDRDFESEASFEISKEDVNENDSLPSQIEDYIAVMLTHLSNPEKYQKYHFKTFYSIFSVPPRTQMPLLFSDAGDSYQCQNCFREFLDQHSLTKHVQNCKFYRSVSSWECMNCREHFNDIVKLSQHIQKKYGILDDSILNLMRSREAVMVPENGSVISLDGRSPNDIEKLYTSKAVTKKDTEESAEQQEDAGDTEEIGLKDSRKQCFVCGYSCQNRRELFKHCENVHKITGNKNRFTECLQCVMYFKSRNLLKEHLRNVHGVQSAKLSELNHTCVICKEKFTDNVHLSKHVKTHGNCLSCLHCSKKFQSYSKLTLHLKSHADKSSRKWITCSICSISIQAEYFGRHLTVHYDRQFGPWRCSVCEKEFKLRNNLKEHLAGEHKNFICEKCGQTFDCLYSFKKHKLHANTDKISTCTVCKTEFQNQKSFVHHKKLHAKSCMCHLCGKKFSTQLTLGRHLKDHQNKLPQCNKTERICNICNKVFNNIGMYRRHQTVHSGEKPYSCQYCDKKYAFNASLKLHMKKSHPEHKPYKCALCGECFFTPHQRMLHMQTHKDCHQSHLYQCFYCPSQFQEEVERTTHIKIEHPEEMGSSTTESRISNTESTLKNVASLLEEQKPVSLDLDKHENCGTSTRIPASTLETENVEIEVLVAEEQVDHNPSESVQNYTINLGPEVFSLACNEQEELILEIPEGMLVETDNGLQIIVSESN